MILIVERKMNKKEKNEADSISMIGGVYYLSRVSSMLSPELIIPNF